MEKKLNLPPETFRTVVASTPLVSIDLVVRSPEGKVLLGMRTNRPAQEMWFVPGGRIQKDEPMDKAFARLLDVELGITPKQVSSRFLGVYQHFYDDNFSGTDFTTHYVVLGYELTLSEQLDSLPKDQHSEYCWLTEDELLAHELVHKHCKWYFEASSRADFGFASEGKKKR